MYQNGERTIAAFLDAETATIDTLVAKVREAVDRLEDLRTAPISAAVTGSTCATPRRAKALSEFQDLAPAATKAKMYSLYLSATRLKSLYLGAG